MAATHQDTAAIHAARIIAINADLAEIALQLAAGTNRPTATAYQLHDLADQLHFIAENLAHVAREDT
jgi:hypothetical protein